MTIRLAEPDDAEALAALYARNRRFLEPYEPEREEAFYTATGQRERIGRALALAERDELHPFVILDESGELAGAVGLEHVVRLAAQSAVLSYWVDQTHTQRGLATSAVGEVVEQAFTTLGLHRLQAATLTDNFPSQRVLSKNGFERIGLARSYLNIGGRWQDHILFQRVAGA